MKILFYMPVCLILAGVVWAQDDESTDFSQEWGEISKEELAMTSIAQDPEADAVILFDKGEIITTSNLDMIFKCHLRMKILTENGKQYADVKIPYWHEDNFWDLRAQSYSPSGQKTKLDKKEIFDQEQEYWKLKVFAIPGVEVGSIIEYRYEIHSEHIHYLEPWYFQNEVYTCFSEVKLVLTSGLNFRSFQENLAFYNPIYTEGQEMDAEKRDKKVATFTWQLTDIPALKSESYIYNRTDYLAKIHFQLVSFKNDYVFYTYIKTWDDLAKVLSNRYKDFLEPDADLKEVVAGLIKSDSTANTKIQSIYDYVCCRIETRDDSRISGDDLKKPAKVYETAIGNPVEKNLLLLNMLRSAGFQAYPLMISTRNHGNLQPEFSTLTQFNYLLVVVRQNEKYQFLDAQDPYCPYGLLPVQSLVRNGFLVDGVKGMIIPVTQTKRTNQVEIASDVKLEDDGSIRFTANLGYSGYPAVRERSELSKTAAKDYLQGKLNELFIGARLDSFSIADRDEIYKPLSVRIQVTIPDYYQRSAQLIYFTPPYLTKIKSNPFVSSKRNFPVDYPYPVNYNEKIKIILPAGAALSEAPPKSKQTFQNIAFSLFSFSGDQELEVQRIFKIYIESFQPAEYTNLRQLYDEMVASDQKQIVLNIK